MTGEHRVLALKWRPLKFDDVIGQPHVVRTLTNALAQGRISHAYLFTGPRGVGKTTCARILARAVNCEKGIGPNPCGECGTCKEILSGRALDVIEIDAASTGNVENVRDLREVVRLAPARARRKVFIIDEAHMLSDAAANALLKTLEEPPAHVLFILATTDPHDLPPTIHSRCQRFEFHPLGPATTVAHLRRIAEAEGIRAEEEALAMIANSSRGAMRDAQMLLEQAASFGTGQVTASSVRELLGLVEREWIDRFLTVLKERDVKGGLSLLNDLIESGRDPSELLMEVELELRDALMARLGSDVAPMSASRLLSAQERSSWFGEEELVSLMAHVRKASEELSSRRAGHPRIGAELAVARLMRRERALSWGEVEAALARVEAGIGQGPARPGGVPSAGDIPRPTAALRPAGIQAGVPGPQAPAGPALSLAEVNRRWPELLEEIKRQHPAVHIYVMNSRVAAVEGGALVLEIASEFHRDGLTKGEMKAKAEGFLSAAFGRSIRLVAREPVAPRAPVAAPQVVSPARPDWVEREPLVKSALDIFKARIVPQKKQEPGQP